MAEFAYNSTKNASTGYMPYELNWSYHPDVTFKDNVDLHSRSYSADELAKELRELIDIYQ